MSMLVSVVVPTFKRRDLLDRCIAALVAQSFDPAAYEIVIVDDAACAETRQQVKGWAKRVAHCGHCVRYLPVCGVGTPHGPATARNLGWRAASMNALRPPGARIAISSLLCWKIMCHIPAPLKP